MNSPALKLDGDAFTSAFPFYLQLDRAYRILRFGRSLAKMVPELMAGEAFDDNFSIYRPRNCGVAAALAKDPDRMVLLEPKRGASIRLRCQWLERHEDHLLLMSPAVTSMEEMTAAGLGMGDFAMHDSTGDMLLIHRTSQMSLMDASRLSQRLKSKSEQLSTIMSLSMSGVAYVNEQSKIDYCNQAFLQIFELTPGEIIGKPVTQWISYFFSLLKGDAAPRMPADGYAIDHVKDARYVLERPHFKVIETRRMETPEGGFVLYLEDITHKFEVDRMKSEFVNTAAHELRTPMASILGFSQLLLRRQFTEEVQHDMMETIYRQSTRMTQLLDDLLNFSQIEARQGTDLQRSQLDMIYIVRQCIDAAHIDPGVFQVKVVCSDTLPDVYGDAGMIKQVVSNVLSNAVKYSPNGGQIVIELVAKEEDAHNGLLIRVSDEGIGLSQDDLARVFERFFRADRSCHIPGTGLGLSLVRQVMSLHRGKVSMQSESGKGSIINLWLPAMTYS